MGHLPHRKNTSASPVRTDVNSGAAPVGRVGRMGARSRRRPGQRRSPVRVRRRRRTRAQKNRPNNWAGRLLVTVGVVIGALFTWTLVIVDDTATVRVTGSYPTRLLKAVGVSEWNFTADRTAIATNSG